MKKLFLFFAVFFISLTSINALELDLYSNNAIVYNYDLDEVIYEKDADKKVSIASLTKIMTSIVLIENIDDLNKTVVLQNKHFVGLKESGASTAGFYVGQKVTYLDLLYGILLPSGADAVQTLALEVFGSNRALVEEMNKKADELKLINTNFANPYGLDDNNHYSTIREVGVILKYALKNETFKKIYTTRKYLISNKQITLFSTIMPSLNTLNINASHIKGSKTGFTYDAGRCLTTLAYDETNDINYLMITTDAPDVGYYHVLDALNTYDKVFSEYSNQSILKSDDIITKIKTKYAKEKQVNVKVNEDIKLFFENKKFDKTKITYDYKLPEKITKILKDNEKVGSVTINYDGKQITTADLYIDGDMHFSIFRFVLNIIIPLSLLAFFTVVVIKNNRKRKKLFIKH